jgi:putative transposase
MTAMGRKPRRDFPGAWHHVMNRGTNHQTIFRSDDDRALFMAELAAVCLTHRMELHAYCLMGTHYHVLVRSLEGRLSAAIHQLATRYGSQFNLRHAQDGPVFRSRYLSVIVEGDAQLISTVRYIHDNPVKANLAVSPAKWRWSSAATYTGEGAIFGCCTTHTLLEICPELREV